VCYFANESLFSAVEVLDEHGVAMMKALGQWFSNVYFGKEHKLLHKEETFKWRSSKSDRAIESGKVIYMRCSTNLLQLVWEGFGNAHGNPPENPEPYPNNEDPDNYFRVFNINQQ
jgi:hypothetical protein